ncbi:MAG: DUF1116 domain-containing protein, partial [SAR202 cluster bacterium]|nr:DUF1116 domain-containing protein [SAR202 cluster bacterium]
MRQNKPLLGEDLKVVNVGLSLFAHALRASGIPVTDLDWRPPAESDFHLTETLRSIQKKNASGHLNIIDEANRTAHQRMLDAQPVLVDVAPAEEVIDGLEDRMLLHAGPPIEWQDMCGPMQAAVLGAIRYEKWTHTDTGAVTALESGEITLQPNHDFGAVGPMTGITSPSMPVFVVENRAFGNRAYCTINEGIGKVMRFGANDDTVIQRLQWLQTGLAPVLREAVQAAGGVELRPIVSRALTMGDEMHQRNVAATSLLMRTLAPHIAGANSISNNIADILRFLADNDQFFLNLAMAIGKATMDPTRDIPNSTMVTAMSRNGTEFGIRVSATGDQWFTADSLMPQGLYFPGFTEADANPDMGDSTIVETMGLGGFAMGAAPAVVGFVGAGTFQDALGYTREMGEITVGPNPNLALPTLDFQGAPCGIDVRKVV